MIQPIATPALAPELKPSEFVEATGAGVDVGAVGGLLAEIVITEGAEVGVALPVAEVLEKAVDAGAQTV